MSKEKHIGIVPFGKRRGTVLAKFDGKKKGFAFSNEASFDSGIVGLKRLIFNKKIFK